MSWQEREQKMKSIKKLGLGGIALLALMAFAGTSSAAAEPEFFAEVFPAELQGSGNQIFKTEAGTISCPTSSQKGEANSSATWWSVKVTDSGCKLNEAGATVDWTGCEIRYYTYSGLYIVCSGSVVKISSGTCVIEIKPQELKSVGFTPTGSGTTRAIIATVEVTEMTFTQSAGCEKGAGTFSTGKLEGKVTLKGLNKGKPQGIFIE
jgi:hypothetical protein